MSEFKVGDRIIYRHFKPEGEAGVVIDPPDEGWRSLLVADEVIVLLDGAADNMYYATPDELERETPQFVNVIESRTIWVTLPGDNAGHKLSEDDAQALFRQLEAIL